MSVNSKMTALADEIRVLSGTEDTMGLDAMTTHVGDANTEIDSQADLIAQIQSAVDNLPEAGGAEPTLQEKTVTPATSSQTVTPDSGYDGLSEVTVNAMPTATQATPNITVSSAGLITASATQIAGYVSAGTKSATKQLTTQAAKTITPNTTEQVAVSAGTYVTGDIMVSAVANSGNSGATGEWILMGSLPMTLATPDSGSAPGSGETTTSSIYYLELDANVQATLFTQVLNGYWITSGIVYWKRGSYVSGKFTEVLTIDTNLSSSFTITDASADDIKILQIEASDVSNWRILPIYKFT